MNHEFLADQNALSREFLAVVEAERAKAAAGITPEHTAILSRNSALVVERDRRVRAGVRVSTSTSDLDQRQLVAALEMGQILGQFSKKQESRAKALEAMMFRALRLLFRANDLLNAPEHAAAVRVEAEVQN